MTSSAAPYIANGMPVADIYGNVTAKLVATTRVVLRPSD
jgi:hypothetical protein